MSECKVIPHAFLKNYVPRTLIFVAGLYGLKLFNNHQYIWGVLEMGLCVLAGILLERYQSKMKCPECGAETTRHNPSRVQSPSIKFHCQTCDVIWDTVRRNPLDY